jgi:hypothetical protein
MIECYSSESRPVSKLATDKHNKNVINEDSINKMQFTKSNQMITTTG